MDDRVYGMLTLQRVRCLRLLADGRTAPEMAEVLGVTVSGVRSHVEDLKDVTGLEDVRALARWWRDGGREGYLRYVAEAAGDRLHRAADRPAGE